MAQYMFFLYDNPAAWQNVSPQEMQKAIEKYMAWGAKLRNLGIYVSSHKLADDVGKVVRGSGSKARVTDGPYSESKEILGGYYMINAASYEEAVKHVMDCPHLEYGGTIEVRVVDQMIPH